MADDFRKHQRTDWGGPSTMSGKQTYGCPCCQRINCGRAKAKKISRRKAKAKVRKQTQQEISNQLDDG